MNLAPALCSSLLECLAGTRQQRNSSLRFLFYVIGDPEFLASSSLCLFFLPVSLLSVSVVSPCPVAEKLVMSSATLGFGNQVFSSVLAAWRPQERGEDDDDDEAQSEQRVFCSRLRFSVGLVAKGQDS